ncbi:uncharacterized protein LOC131890437 [Tigriopus californicus]|uniref:uncharacterized protein LOC131890437 n=1 Tax=Tigriopus californicus TaxID=6832 RepID=UPI0027DA89AB|nr:uncharacterized protein LOC131890437 [Tigriopus californicus]
MRGDFHNWYWRHCSNAPTISVSDASRFVYQLPFFLVGPKSKPYKPYLNMTKPYTVFTWTIFLISLACYLVTIVFVQTFMIVKEHRDPDITKWIISYIGILSFQAAPPSVATPKSPTLALLFQVWLVASFLLVAGYECNLRANIIVKEYEAPIETDVDILNRGVQLHVSKGSIFAPLFRHSPNAIRRTLGQQMDENENYYPLNGGLIPEAYEKCIKDNGDVFLGNDMMTRAMFPTFEERHGEQPYRIGRVNFEPDTYSSFVITKGQRRLRKEVDSVIRGLTEGGIIHQLIKSYIKPQHLVRNDVQDEVLKPFTMEQVFGAFVVFLCGQTLASFVLLLEMVAFPKAKSASPQFGSSIIQVQSVHDQAYYKWK